MIKKITTATIGLTKTSTKSTAKFNYKAFAKPYLTDCPLKIAIVVSVWISDYVRVFPVHQLYKFPTSTY